jgi:putative nucleotidyltransferase with HDIG domain
VSFLISLTTVVVVGIASKSLLWVTFTALHLFMVGLQGENLKRTHVVQIPFLISASLLNQQVCYINLAAYCLLTILSCRAGFDRMLSILMGDCVAVLLCVLGQPYVPADLVPAYGTVYLTIRSLVSSWTSRLTGLPLDIGSISGGWAFLGAIVFATVGLTVFYFERVELTWSMLAQYALLSLIWIVTLSSYQKASDVFQAGLIGVGNLLSYAHSYTAGHSRRVGYLARETGRRLGILEWKLDNVVRAALLHDIGKLAVDERILEKPGRLTDDEFDIIKTHPVVGEKIVASINELASIAPWIRHHHERIDGRGYPDGILERTIPLESRLICVIDAYDAMTGSSADGHRRLYRDPVSSDAALEELKRCAGTQFDQRVVKAFTRVIRASQKETP